MNTVTSSDGTTIAYDRRGIGEPLILAGGAFQHRAVDRRTGELAELLAADFTVFHYDRRGRGDSTDTAPYAVEREIEDLEALAKEAGGSAFLEVAHTLPYDAALLDGTMAGAPLPAQRWSSVTSPVLVADGGAGPPSIRAAADALAALLADAHRRTLPGQQHDVAPGVLAPILAEFFAA
jgi:hypothetical protein